MHGNDTVQPRDDHGCVLALGHDGPHEFADPNGRRWLWETDLECDCEHCMRCEGDYCTVYWEKPTNGVALPAPDLAKKPTVTHLMRLAVAMRHAPSDGYDDAYKCMQNALYAALGVASPINNSSEIPNSSFDAAGVKVLNKEQTMGENHPCPCDLMTGKFDKNCMFHRHLAAQLDADIARLMAAPEAEVEAELRSMGMGPADAARRGHSAVQKALAIFHITRAEIRLQADALHLVRDHLKAAREALRSKPSGVQASGEPGEAGKQLAIKEHREKQARDAGTYTPSREVVQQALELVDRIRDSHASWGGWSGLPATCERITYMLRYGKSPDGVAEGRHQTLSDQSPTPAPSAIQSHLKGEQ
jgi:hypothetical protein